ncbi:MAG TPA: hypothetical protein VGR11_13935 [Solirubrobacteraceae bacterium]|nr:hypothetical protein [Solirubrobacteraceae bacterium]
MLRQGPIPRFVHGIIDYGYAALLIVAPFLIGFSDEGAATAVSIVAGIIVLIGAATTEGFRTSLIKSLPVTGHIALDLVLAGAMVASPFLFGFSEEGTPTAFFIVAGIVALLVTLATRWLPEKAARAS